MSLHGYDVSIELGRSALNKLLDALEHSALWTGTFEGDQSRAVPDGFLARVQYKIRLYDIRVRPDAEQEDHLVSSIALLLNVTGDAIIDISLDSQPLLHHQIDIDGTVSVVVNFDLTFTNEEHRLTITFGDAVVQNVTLKGLIDDITRMMETSFKFLIQEELRRHQQNVPLTGILVLSGSPQGRLEAIMLKTHFYRTEPDDSAVGLGIVFEPGAAPQTQRRPLALKRLADQDLVLSVHQDYLNRVIANALSDSAPALVGGPLFDDKVLKSGLQVQSIVVAVDGPKIRATVRAGWRRTDLFLQASIVPDVSGQRLSFEVVDVISDVPTWTGVLIKIALNIIAWAVLSIANSLVAGQAEKRLKVIEDQTNGFVVESTLFQKFPEGLTLKATPKSIGLSDGNITLGYELSAALK